MPREGQSKVLTKKEFNWLIKIVSTGNLAKRNIALLYVSFGLGLRVKEIASLNINHVMNKNYSPLFRSQKNQRFSPNSLQQVFSKIYNKAGFVGASSHSGRRTFATRLIENGIDIKAVSLLMGHKTISMTAKYVENNPIRLKRIAQQVCL